MKPFMLFVGITVWMTGLFLTIVVIGFAVAIIEQFQKWRERRKAFRARCAEVRARATRDQLLSPYPSKPTLPQNHDMDVNLGKRYAEARARGGRNTL